MAWILDVFDGGPEFHYWHGARPQAHQASRGASPCHCSYDPSFARPDAVSVDVLREQIRTKHLDDLTVVEINIR